MNHDRAALPSARPAPRLPRAETLRSGSTCNDDDIAVSHVGLLLVLIRIADYPNIVDSQKV